MDVSKYYNIAKENPLIINNTNHLFMVYENLYGTYFYHNKIFNGFELLSLDAKYFFINSTFLNLDTITNFLNGQNIPNSDKGFLYTETIYKLKGDENV